MTITTTLVPPSRGGAPATFSADMDAFLAALPTWTTQANALESNVNAKEASVTSAATTATTKAGEAATSASNAATSASTASTQASNASTSATNAATSATSAANSASAAAASAASVNLATPGPIGSTTPNSGAFTTLSATGNVLVRIATKDTTGTVNPSTQIHGPTGTEGSFASYAWAVGATSSPYWTLNKSRGAAVGTRGLVAADDLLGQIDFCGDDGASFVRGATIHVRTEGTPASGVMPARIAFLTTNLAGGSPTERMRIDSSGGVGIGGTAAAGETLRIGRSVTGATLSIAAHLMGTVQSDVTGTGFGVRNLLNTQAASFTLGSYYHFQALESTIGAGSAVTSQVGFGSASGNISATTNYGFLAADTSAVTSGKTAYGFYSGVNTASGGGTAYGFYAAGTAPNRFVGETLVIGAKGLGYGTGAGGTVTQATSRTTGVTLNKPTGAITLVSAAGSTSWQSFTVTNSLVAATDVVLVSQKSGTDKYMMHVTNVAAGSFQITFATTGGTTTEQPVFNVAVIKGATS